MMDGVTEITEDKLPARKLRGTNKNANPSYKEPNPKTIGWNKLKQGKWNCRKDYRRAGLQYVIEKLLENDMNEGELNNIVADAIEADALKELNN
jgi:hypothetical protein